MQSVSQRESEKNSFRYVARQPIIGANRHVFGYELLFRSGIENYFQCKDQEHASNSVIDLSSLYGFNILCNNSLGFINCTRETLLGENIYLLPPERVVVEVLESVTPDAEVRLACCRLKNAGYRIALDDVILDDPRECLEDLADFIKIDGLLVSHEKAASIAARFRGHRCRVLAEKVETWQDFALMRDAGCTLFQGYFFRKPEMIRIRRVLENQRAYQRLLIAVTRPSLDWKEIEDALKMDATLCYRLLRYLNSAAFGFQNEIRSLRQALIILGEEALIRWCRLTILLEMSKSRPSDLALAALTRARFSELLGCRVNRGTTDLFLLGLLSLMDSILEIPIGMVVQNLILENDIRAALLGETSRFGVIYELIQAADAGAWELVSNLCKVMQLDENFVADCYWSSMQWAHEIVMAA
jgi:c-di-GMP-related signal transduction protein